MKLFISVFRLYNIGGIESSLLNLLNEFKNDYDITLCVLTDEINKEFTIENVKIIDGSKCLRDSFLSRDYLKFQSIFNRLIRNYRRLKRIIFGKKYIIKKSLIKIKSNITYDVAIAFINDTYTVDGIFKSGGDYEYINKHINAKKKIAWIHGSPIVEGFTSREICKQVFTPFDYIINVSRYCKALFDEIIPEFKNKSLVVYNMYDISRIIKLSVEYNPYSNISNKLHFVTVSRLDNKSKRLDRIIKVCHQLVRQGFSDFDWTIVGDGPDLNTLKKMVIDKKLTGIVNLVGAKYNPYPYMKYADLYISSSSYESYGMSVREAQILKCPVLITEVGPSNEIVDNFKNGIICDNSTKGLYESIRNILNDISVLFPIREYLVENEITNEQAKEQFNALIKK